METRHLHWILIDPLFAVRAPRWDYSKTLTSVQLHLHLYLFRHLKWYQKRHTLTHYTQSTATDDINILFTRLNPVTNYKLQIKTIKKHKM